MCAWRSMNFGISEGREIPPPSEIFRAKRSRHETAPHTPYPMGPKSPQPLREAAQYNDPSERQHLPRRFCIHSSLT